MESFFGGRDPGVIFVRCCRSAARAPPCPAGGALELPGRPHKGSESALCEPYVDVPGRATRACNLRGIARTSHFRGTCLREVCRGSSDDDFGGPMTLPLLFARVCGPPEPSLDLPGPPHRGQKRACEPYVDVPEAPGRATRACNLRRIARTSHFRGTCLREVCRGSSDDDFGGPMTLPHAICEGLWPSPNPPWSFRGLHIGVRSALVKPYVDGPRGPGEGHESLQFTKGSRAHPIFAALACVKCVEEVRMTISVGR